MTSRKFEVEIHEEDNDKFFVLLDDSPLSRDKISWGKMLELLSLGFEKKLLEDKAEQRWERYLWHLKRSNNSIMDLEQLIKDMDHEIAVQEEKNKSSKND